MHLGYGRKNFQRPGPSLVRQVLPSLRSRSDWALWDEPQYVELRDTAASSSCLWKCSAHTLRTYQVYLSSHIPGRFGRELKIEIYLVPGTKLV